MLPVLSITAHLLAAIVWVGTLFSWGMLYTPALKRLEGYASVEGQLRRRLMLLQNICFGVLLLTGVYLMTQDIHYTGWLSFNNRWSQLLLLKHISIGFMILLVILLSSVVEPLRRQSVLKRGGGSARTIAAMGKADTEGAIRPGYAHLGAQRGARVAINVPYFAWISPDLVAATDAHGHLVAQC